ncbi:MAG: putative quinol monooxygenase [Bryobacteraceae bacterium]
MILVTGSITARVDSFEVVLEHCVTHVRRSRTEPGCISHAVHRDAENPLRLVFVEQWRDMPAVLRHFAVSGSREFVKTVGVLAAATPDIQIYDATPIAFPPA